MRRMIPVLGAVAALAVSSSAFAGHSAVELYQYFGDPVVGNLGDPAPGAPANTSPLADPTVQILQGSGAKTIWFPIYMELRAGNGRPTLASIGYQVYETGTLSGLTTNGGNTSVSPFAADGSVLAAAPGDNSAHSLGGTGTMFRNTQFHAKTAASPDPGNGTFFLGWMSVDLAGGYVAGQISDLWLSVSTDAARTYSFTTTSATLNTLAFGADAANAEGDGDGLNAFRLQNTNLDVGVGAGLMSTLADARIEILVPEPTTIGLLGLGLLAIRRRRA